jgi:hypothetical protein
VSLPTAILSGKKPKRESIEMSYSARGDDSIRFIKNMAKLLYFFLPVLIPASPAHAADSFVVGPSFGSDSVVV